MALGSSRHQGQGSRRVPTDAGLARMAHWTTQTSNQTCTTVHWLALPSHQLAQAPLVPHKARETRACHTPARAHSPEKAHQTQPHQLASRRWSRNTSQHLKATKGGLCPHQLAQAPLVAHKAHQLVDARPLAGSEPARVGFVESIPQTDAQSSAQCDQLDDAGWR